MNSNTFLTSIIGHVYGSFKKLKINTKIINFISVKESQYYELKATIQF